MAIKLLLDNISQNLKNNLNELFHLNFFRKPKPPTSKSSAGSTTVLIMVTEEIMLFTWPWQYWGSGSKNVFFHFSMNSAILSFYHGIRNRAICFHHHGSAVVLSADDQEDWCQEFHVSFEIELHEGGYQNENFHIQLTHTF